MSSNLHKKVPSRASLPRKTTRGPLDNDDDPLSATLSPASTQASSLTSPLAKSQDVNPFDQQNEAQSILLDDQTDQSVIDNNSKNLSFLLDSSIYHPLSQVDVPVPFRKPSVGPPPPGTSVEQALDQVGKLIAKCDFLGAAHFAAICLTGGLVQPTDHVSIFRLLATRYSCLELVGQIMLAAREAKALEDLSSDFYYIVPTASEEQIEAHNGIHPPPQHIMPFSLRVQAIRLQNIGFSDPRRGVTALYDLGLEAREHLTSPYANAADQQKWKSRLKSLSMHVVNALIELGDLDCAQRTLAQSKPKDLEEVAQWASRMALMLVKLGQLDKAQTYVDTIGIENKNHALLSSILATANGQIDKGVMLLESVTRRDADPELMVLAKQNLAVAYLYSGRILDAKKLLEDLIDQGHSFQSLIINLATIFDLTSDRSKDQKNKLINKLANWSIPRRPLTNADFKL